MRAAIYNPYLDTLGGGERYVMGVAKALVAKGYQVDVEWPDESIKTRLEKRFGLDLTGINFVKSINRGDGYELCFWLSDGSIPILRARKNFLHFQSPFKNVGGKSLINKMKLFRIKKIICNSYFTKSWIDEEFGVESVVVYPPVTTGEFKPRRKEKLIIYVGRFSQLEQAKRQDVLIRAFRKFYDAGNKEWRLILAGGSEVGADDYVKKLRRMASGYPIRILESPGFAQIKEFYGRAKIFWSASGFGIDEEKEPQKVEHFGITVVEAMASGAVPVVLASGGHKEIVADGQNGFLWKRTTELLNKTEKLISEKGLFRKISAEAIKSSRVYDDARFEKEIWDLL